MSDTEKKEPGERRRILVVEDYPDAREMYAEYFSFIGYDVELAANGQEALEKARSQAPDAIVMDLSLPVLDGWEATRLLKQDERTKDIPVLAVSGHAMGSNSREAIEAGCDDFVAKPALPQDVEDRIRRLLRGRGRV